MMIESMIFTPLKAKFTTLASQRAHLIKLVSQFGNLSDAEMKFTVASILCLAIMIYEAGDDEIGRDLQRQILDLQSIHKRDLKYMQKLNYLNKHITNFKPAIFKSIRAYFSNLYQIDAELVTCLPKTLGQQIGAKVAINKTPEDINPIVFYVKSHQAFCSKSDPYYMAISSDGTATVDFKELFIYKVLEYIGFGPKVHFIVDSEFPYLGVEEGILIATQDLSYTKHFHQKSKSFKTFGEVKAELNRKSIENIDEATKRDIIAIDILSRAFLLEDVMINQGNFGVSISTRIFEPTVSTIKWKIIDFLAPRLRRSKGQGTANDYTYGRHYPAGKDIFHSFRIGNASHSYDREELAIIRLLLSEEHAKDLWLAAMDKLSGPLDQAVERAFENIHQFMIENTDILQIKSARLESKMADLATYKASIMQNFIALERGLKDYVSAQVKPLPSPQ